MRIQPILALVGALSVAACSGGGGSGGVTPPASSGASQSNPSNPPQNSSGSSNANANVVYHVSELPTFGGALGSAATINARQWVMGSADPTGDVVSNAALWIGNTAKNLGTLGGPNSAISWPNLNNFGVISGISETAAMNTYNEPWSCTGFFLPVFTPTGHVCVGFRYQNGVMTPLPTLGGEDGYAAGNNNWGQIVGWAENTTHDPTCTNGQVFQFEPVVWDASNRVHQLPPLSGDPDGAATAINDLGQIVGISGICDQAVGRFTALHVVEWHNGSVRELFNPGTHAWNTPQAINDRGDVTGFINMPGADDAAGKLRPIAFLYTHDGKLIRLPLLSGDSYSFGNGINDEGDVVGISFNATFTSSRAFLYHNGKSVDLNSLVGSGTPFLLAANAIDDFGTIVGQASVSSTSAPAFIAHLSIGCTEDSAVTAAMKSQAARKPIMLSMQLRQQLLHRYNIR